MATWIETNGSRSATIHRKGKRAESTIQREYRVFGAADDSEVHAEANNRFTAERFYQIGDLTLMVESYSVSHVAEQVWDVTVTYTKTGGDDDNPLRRTRSFDTGGATAHMTQAISSPTFPTGEQRFPPSAPDQKGAIGVDGQRVVGVDVVTPALTWTEAYDVPGAYVTPAYIKMLSELTGSVNNATFRTFRAGEVLFVGCSGSQEWDSEKGDGPWSLSYKFTASGNCGGGQTYPALTVGDITDVQKDGHDFLWVSYEAAVSSSSLLRVPKYVYVNKVYRRADFSRLGIGVA